MRKVVASFIGMIVFTTVEAQITITRADLPNRNLSSADKLPDSVMYTKVHVGNPISYQQTGLSFAWNEANIGGTQAYMYFLPVTSVPAYLQSGFVGSSHAQAIINEEALVGGSLNDGYEFFAYTNNNTRYGIRGFGGKLLLPNIPDTLSFKAIFTNPDVLFTLPMNYGNKDSSTSAFTVIIPTAGLSLPNPVGDIFIKRTQKRVNEVDGWGTLTLPNGMSYNVLRHVSKIDRVDSLINDITAQGFPNQLIEYRWLGLQRKIPVLQINTSNNNGQVLVKEITMLGIVTPSSINNISSGSPLRVYPNPCNDVLHIDAPKGNGDWQIQLVDMMGRRCAQFHFNTGNTVETIPVQGLAAGQYVLYVQREGKTNTHLVNIGSH